MNNNSSFGWQILSCFVGYSILIIAANLLYNVPFAISSPLFVFRKLGFSEWPLQWNIAIGVSIFITILLFFLNPWRPRNIYGGAKFANEKLIKEMGLRNKDGVILGLTKTNGTLKKNGKKFIHTPPIIGTLGTKYLRMNDPLSILVYAPPGTGKTSGILIPSIVGSSASWVVLDLKGEIYNITSAYRSNISKIVRFAPGESESTRWNPLGKAELPEKPEDIQIHVSRVAESVIASQAKGGAADNDMWDREARSYFRFWAQYLIWKHGETSLGGIMDAALSGHPQDSIADVFNVDGDKIPDHIKREGVQFPGMSDKQFDGVFGTFKSKMDLYLDIRVKRNLSANDFSFKQLREERTTIYFVVSPPDLDRLKPIISLFFELCALQLLSKMPKDNDLQVTFGLDEFVQLQKLTRVIKIPDVGRGYKFNALYICQSISQLKDLYGQEAASALCNTCTYSVIFAQSELSVAKDISSLIGKYTFTKESRSERDKSLFTSITSHEEGIELVKPQDISSLSPGHILVMREGFWQNPIKAYAAFYFLDHAILKLLKMKRIESNFVAVKEHDKNHTENEIAKVNAVNRLPSSEPSAIPTEEPNNEEVEVENIYTAGLPPLDASLQDINDFELEMTNTMPDLFDDDDDSSILPKENDIPG